MKRRKPINRPEQALQRACVGLLERFYDPLPDVFWTAINPVPAKSKAVAGISKAMGLRPGVTDFIFLRTSMVPLVYPEAPEKRLYAMMLELKAPGGKLSKNQRELYDKALSMGIHFQTVDDIEGFVHALENFGIYPKRKFTLRQSADGYLTNHL
jgi:hypothetical protein